MSSTRVIIRNVPEYASEARLRAFVAGVAEAPLTDLRVVRAPSGRSRRFAFAGFSTPAAAAAVVQRLDRAFFDTARLQVSLALAPGASELPRPWSRYTRGSSAFERRGAAAGSSVAAAGGSGAAVAAEDVDAAPGVFGGAAPGGAASGGAPRNASPESSKKGANFEGGGKTGPKAAAAPAAAGVEAEWVLAAQKRKGKRTWQNDDFAAAQPAAAPAPPAAAAAAFPGPGTPSTAASDHSDGAAGRSRGKRRRAAAAPAPAAGSDAKKVRGAGPTGGGENGDGDGASASPAAEEEEDPLAWLRKAAVVADFAEPAPGAGEAGGGEAGAGGGDAAAEAGGSDGSAAAAGGGSGPALALATGRLLFTNLPYCTTESLFRASLDAETAANVSAVHVSADELLGRGAGRAFVQFSSGEAAAAALARLDRQIFCGRIVRVEAARPLPEEKIEKVAGRRKKAAISSFKRKQEEVRKAAAMTETKAWNLLYVGAAAAATAAAAAAGAATAATAAAGDDAAAEAAAAGAIGAAGSAGAGPAARRALLGIDASGRPILDASSAAATLALAETRVISDTKEWIARQGINAAAFERTGEALLREFIPAHRRDVTRADDAIVVKHLPPAACTEADLFNLFSKFGDLVRCSLAPAGTVALVQFLYPVRARAAFAKLAYSRFKGTVPLYLEWAPSDAFVGEKPEGVVVAAKGGKVVAGAAAGGAVAGGGDVGGGIAGSIRVSGSSLAAGAAPAADAAVAGAAAAAGVAAGATASLLALIAAQDEAEQTQHVSLFVSNISFDSPAEEIEELFRKQPDFVTFTLTRKRRGERVLSAGYGFAEFKSARAAAAAVEKLQGVPVRGHALELRVSHRAAASAAASGAAADASAGTPRAKRAGAADSGQNGEKGRAGKSGRGDSKDAGGGSKDAAGGSKDAGGGTAAAGADAAGSAAAAAAAAAIPPFTPKLTVRNLAFQATASDLRQLFEAYGTVAGVRIPKKANGESRGYGFVELASRAEAVAAVAALQHTHLYGRRLVLEVAKE